MVDSPFKALTDALQDYVRWRGCCWNCVESRTMPVSDVDHALLTLRCADLTILFTIAPSVAALQSRFESTWDAGNNARWIRRC